MKIRAIDGDDQLQQAIRSTMVSLAEIPAEQRFEPIIHKIGNATVVMLGAASYGTSQFQRARAEITKLLIERKGFNAVAIEADWLDVERIHRYVRNQSEDQSADEALADFRHFPQWMWRNCEVAEFVEWLRHQNRQRDVGARVGFYGLDFYSHQAAMAATINYLERIDRQAAQQARYRYSCFEQFDQDPQQSGYATDYSLPPQRTDEIIALLVAQNRQRAQDLRQKDSARAGDSFYPQWMEQLSDSAEEYYRALFRGRNSGWNLREHHLFDSLLTLTSHLHNSNTDPKIVVWAHNAHVGDARFSEMSTRGEINWGQLVKEVYANKATLVGFTTYHGTIAASSTWGGNVEEKQMRPALPESYEALFHTLGAKDFLLDLREPAIHEDLRKARLERSIDVVYRPQTERISHYFYAQLSLQFDLLIHFDQTDALVPIQKE